MVARSNPALIFTSTSRSIQNLHFLVPTSQVLCIVFGTDRSNIIILYIYLCYRSVKYYRIVHAFTGTVWSSVIVLYCICIYRYTDRSNVIVLYLHLNVPAGQVLLYCIVFAFTGTDRSNVIILYIYLFHWLVKYYFIVYAFTGTVWSSVIVMYINLQVPVSLVYPWCSGPSTFYAQTGRIGVY